MNKQSIVYLSNGARCLVISENYDHLLDLDHNKHFYFRLVKLDSENESDWWNAKYWIQYYLGSPAGKVSGISII